MEKIKKSNNVTLPDTILYLESVVEIIDIFVKNTSECSIEIDGFKLENADEINNLNNKIVKEIDIYTRNPHVSFRYSELGAKLEYEGDNVIASGIYFSVYDIFKSHKRKYTQKLRFVLTSILICFFMITPLFLGLIKINLFFQLPASIIFPIIACVMLSKASLLSTSRLYLYKNNKEKKKIDLSQIIIPVISSIVTAIVTFILTRLFS
jgi:hypothetical protein